MTDGRYQDTADSQYQDTAERRITAQKSLQEISQHATVFFPAAALHVRPRLGKKLPHADLCLADFSGRLRFSFRRCRDIGHPSLAKHGSAVCH